MLNGVRTPLKCNIIPLPTKPHSSLLSLWISFNPTCLITSIMTTLDWVSAVWDFYYVMLNIITSNVVQTEVKQAEVEQG